MATLELPSRLISWRTLTKTSGPVRPDFSVTSWMVDTRVTASPTRTGSWNWNWLPAHIRRGRGMGGGTHRAWHVRRDRFPTGDGAAGRSEERRVGKEGR